MMAMARWRRGVMVCAPGLWLIPGAMGQTAALDRVPAGTPLIVSVPSLAKLESGFSFIEKTFGMSPDEGPLAEMKLHQVLNIEGLNKQGALALAILGNDEGQVDFEAEEPPMIMIIPVSDYAKFAAAGGADAQGAVSEWDPLDEGPAFIKNLGGGFAVVGSTQEMVEAFKGAPGNNAAHTTLMGANGRPVAETSLVTIIADLQALAPQIKEGFNQFKGQMDNMAQMAGQAAPINAATIDAFGEALTRDGQAATIGVNAGEPGVSLNVAAQFKEGSESARYFNTKGKASTLLDRVPDQPFLFAFAFDGSGPGLKQLLKQAMGQAAAADPEGDKAMGLTGALVKAVDTWDGTAFLMGMPPAIMGGGLFANTTAYFRTSDPQAFKAVIKDAIGAMNGQEVQGFTYQTSYKPAAKPVGGVSADEWSLRMQADPDDPNAQQAMMAMSMIFGMEGGPSGFLAPVDGGVAFTYSKNSQLLEQALAAAKGGGLGADAGIKAVATSLPADRTIEGYIGVKSMLDMFMQFAAMMGGGAPELDIPEDLQPIGFGGTTTSGGVRLVVFAPTQVLTTMKKVIEAGENMGGGQQDGAGQPRF